MTYRIGRADINQCELTTHDNTAVDVSHIVHVLSYYEDIFLPNISCNIGVVDGVAFASTYSLSGGETLKLNFAEREGTEVAANLVLNTMSERQRENPDYEYYILNFITDDSMVDLTKIVTKGYSKPIHDIVRDVITEFFPDQTIAEIEETEGIRNLVGTFMSPFTFIQHCVSESKSIENPKSTFVFFERQDGYHFVTLDKLYSQEPAYRFVYDELVNSEHTKADAMVNNIRHLNIQAPIDLQGKQLAGMHHSLNQSFDPLSKSFLSEAVATESNTITGKVRDRYFGAPTTRMFTITDGRSADIEYVQKDVNYNKIRQRDKFGAQRRAGMTQFNSIKLTFSIPGNSSVEVGRTVNIAIPRASQTKEEQPLNEPQISGKYLITAVHHKIAIAPENEYVTICECMRPSFEEAVE